MIYQFMNIRRELATIILLQCVFITHCLSQINATHRVPVNKNLPGSWYAELYKDGRKDWSGQDLKTIGMPCGGIGAGQLYVRGDGTLSCWWIANNAYNTGDGSTDCWNFDTPLGPWKTGYQTYTPISYITQGFDVKINRHTFHLNRSDFDAIRFKGEYPVATIDYQNSRKKLPVAIRLKVFSPFIPLDAKESGTPATVMQFILTNQSAQAQVLSLNGYLQNTVGLDLIDQARGDSRNQVIRGKQMTSILMDLDHSTIPDKHPYFGNMSLSLLNDNVSATAEQGRQSVKAEKPLGQKLIGELGVNIKLKPGETKSFIYLLSWYFPNRIKELSGEWCRPVRTDGPVIGNMYSQWYSSSTEVAVWLRDNLPRLKNQTESFVNAYYHHSTLPYWLNRRIMMPVSNLATGTTEWWANGRFWAWEGVGSCVGICTHVWNYEQGLANLFPELERNMRERGDFGAAYNQNGMVNMRDSLHMDAIDGQAGTVLKAYREHLMTNDNDFLMRNWPKIKQAEVYLIKQDSDLKGIIEGRQPNTFDVAFYGPNTFIGSLYLASLKASEKMAIIVGDHAFSRSCDSIFQNGRKYSINNLWNGHYFIQKLTPNINKHQYGDGCLSDQLFGQTWANLLNLGELYPDTLTKTALQSVYRYNWAPDVYVQNKYHSPERPFADPGEAGLFVCSWPYSWHPGNNGVRYADEVWTGVEYEVATNMIYEGLINEALNIIKGVNDRYSPQKHNPYNEFECGDHYARALASYGILKAIEGYQYNGPNEEISFNPVITPDHFSGFFTSAESWGNIVQERNGKTQIDEIQLKYGRLKLRSFIIELRVNNPLPKVTLRLGPSEVPCYWKLKGTKMVLSFRPIIIQSGQTLKIRCT
ncbi:MAG TPA: GH116 family glycosyl hydrolase [Mucilaginibacter sp.]